MRAEQGNGSEEHPLTRPATDRREGRRPIHRRQRNESRPLGGNRCAGGRRVTRPPEPPQQAPRCSRATPSPSFLEMQRRPIRPDQFIRGGTVPLRVTERCDRVGTSRTRIAPDGLGLVRNEASDLDGLRVHRERERVRSIRLSVSATAGSGCTHRASEQPGRGRRGLRPFSSVDRAAPSSSGVGVALVPPVCRRPRSRSPQARAAASGR